MFKELWVIEFISLSFNLSKLFFFFSLFHSQENIIKKKETERRDWFRKHDENRRNKLTEITSVDCIRSKEKNGFSLKTTVRSTERTTIRLLLVYCIVPANNHSCFRVESSVYPLADDIIVENFHISPFLLKN